MKSCCSFEHQTIHFTFFIEPILNTKRNLTVERERGTYRYTKKKTRAITESKEGNYPEMDGGYHTAFIINIFQF